MRFELMQPSHTAQVAEIHMEGQPGTLLTRMGKQFLACMYAEVVASEWGFGVVAVDGETVVAVAVLTTSTNSLFDYLKRRRLLPMAWALLPQLARRPHLLVDLYQAWRYPSKLGAGQKGLSGTRERPAESPKAADDAEFLFLGVRGTYRKQKVALSMFEHVLDVCQQRGIGHVTALVDEANDRLHEIGDRRLGHCGWRRVRQIEFNGRPMDVIEFDLSGEESGKLESVASAVSCQKT